MKKKIISLILASALTLSLCACDKSDDDKKDNKKDSEKTEETEEETEESSETEAPAESETTETTAEVDDGLKEVDLTYFTLRYDDTLWQFDEEEDISDSDSSSNLYMGIPNEEQPEYTRLTVKIKVVDGDVKDFRDKLNQYDLDEYEYAVNGAYERVDIDGLEFVYATDPTFTDTHCYMTRVEGANKTIYITFSGDIQNTEDKDLISNITFKLEDEGNTDYPWYWEGTPIDNGDHQVTVGDITLDSHQLKLEDPIHTHEIFDHHVLAVGDKIYVLSTDVVRVFTFDGSELTYVKDIELDKECSEITVAANGNIYVSGFDGPIIIKDDEVVSDVDEWGIYNLLAFPGTDTGISYFASTVKNATFTADGVELGDEIEFPEISTMFGIQLTADKIIIFGTNAETNKHNVFIYNKDGSLDKTLAVPEDESFGMGCVTYLAQNDNYYMAIDGNMRAIFFFTKDGEYIGKTSDGDLFGTYYPWFASSTTLDDGTILSIMTDERSDKSCQELIAFSIKGL